MPNTLQLTLVIHNHQPVGNFDKVIHEACDKSYLPFLRVLREFTGVRIGLHTSGCLWEWLEQNRPEYGELVAELLAAGQLELLSGGMYEPILPVLPLRDAVWQLERMNSFIKDRFGVEPRGMWCPERVWEPHLPEVIARAGLEYTLLDDFHFRGSAPEKQVRTGYFITEHAGSMCSLFPISEELRYSMPFKVVPETINYLRQLMENAESVPLVVFGDDGEKFGIWPKTYEWVYEKHWLKDFFGELEANSEWLELLLPGEVIDRRQPDDRVFVPCASYMEMGEWTQIGAEHKEAAPPGFWRNFFHKYPESYAIHRRMLGVSELLERARGECDQPTQLEQAADDLGRAQCNCAYWHGVFGGLYLNYLRHALSFHTLKAEQRILRNCASITPDTVTLSDHDGTGREQVLLRSEELFAITDPANGMALTRLDHLPGCFCWSDVLARRTEAYHEDVAGAQLDTGEEHGSIHDVVLTKELGLERYLVPDPHPRASFVTFFSQLQSPEEILSTSQQGIAEWDWQLRDYGRQATRLKIKDTGAHGYIDVGQYTLKKSIKLRSDGLKFRVALAEGVLPADAGDFFVELNFTLLTDQAEDRYLDIDGNHHPVNAVGSWDTAEQAGLADGWQQRQLNLSAEQLKQLLYYPVYAVSSSEGGFEKTYQGSCLLFRFDPQALKSGITIRLNIDNLTGAESNG